MSFRASILTLYPEMFPGPLGISLAGEGLRKELWSLDTHQIREHGIGRHRNVDDNPAGGGAGMVLRCDVLAAAIDAVVPADDARPRLLMLDEPSLGLAPLITREVLQVVASLRRHGVSVLLVEQNARAALQVADRAYVLEMGAVALSGDAQDLLNDRRIIDTYLGMGANAHREPAASA